MSKENKVEMTAQSIWNEHKNAIDFKSKLGENGLFEQTKKNERFYIGDQWLGSTTKSKLPLIIINFVKRIGEYKLSQILANPLTANFSAEGINSFVGKNADGETQTLDSENQVLGDLQNGDNTSFNELDTEEQINMTMAVLTDYFKTSSERLKLDMSAANAAKNAYICGTGAIYTYWDPNIKTGLFADTDKTTAITGDIMIEILDAVSQIEFENPTEKDINKQDYIIISKKITVAEAKRIAKANGLSDEDINKIKSDNNSDDISYERDEDSSDSVERVTVLTKIYKEWSDDGKDYTLFAVQSTEQVIIREPWDTALQHYPVALFRWEDREKCIYGDSEVTSLIPNQIAVNRMSTAAVWSSMLNGMPIMCVDRTMVHGTVTNQPGQILEFNGQSGAFRNAVGYITPPPPSTALTSNVSDIINNTLQHAGANDAALGNLNPNNATAVIALREAATAPMQLLKNRYYQFIEDIARIWAEMLVNNYGNRSLKVEDKNGNWYLPFDSENFKNLVVSVRVDVGASTIWSTAQAQQILDNWLGNGLIKFDQYLERLPSGLVTDIAGLLKDVKEQQAQAERLQQEQLAQSQSVDNLQLGDIYNDLTPEEKAKLDSMTLEEQQALSDNAKAEME